MQPSILLVPPSMYNIADKVLYTKDLLETQFGNYIKTQYREERPRWERNKNYLRYGDKFNLDRIIRREHYDENCYTTKKFHLPKAMRKQGYYVKRIFHIGYMQTDCEPKICKRRK